MAAEPLNASFATWLPAYLADELRPERVNQWVERTRCAIIEALPQILENPDLARHVDAAIREHWLAFLGDFAHPEPQFHLVAAGQQFAREMAIQQFPLEAVVKVYRAAQQESWSYVTGVVASIPAHQADPAEVLIYFWSRAGTWIDSSIGESIDIFHAERARALASASAQQYELVRELLAGSEPDQKRTSAALGGYPISSVNTALILDTEDPEAITDLEKLAKASCRALGGSQVLIVPPGGRTLWAWVATRKEPALSALETMEPRLRAARARLYVGTPAIGIPGFVTSFQEAERTRQIAHRRREHGPISTYAEIEIVALVGCTPAVDRFMTRTLGQLALTDEATDRLRETVRVYLACGGNVDDASGPLSVHPNTVRYRISRVEDILGAPINRFGTDLSLALRHHEAFHHANS